MRGDGQRQHPTPLPERGGAAGGGGGTVAIVGLGAAAEVSRSRVRPIQSPCRLVTARVNDLYRLSFGFSNTLSQPSDAHCLLYCACRAPFSTAPGERGRLVSMGGGGLPAAGDVGGRLAAIVDELGASTSRVCPVRVGALIQQLQNAEQM